MSRSAVRTLSATTVAALLVGLLLLTGCGAKQQLSAAEVDAGLALLDEVEQAVDEGDCARARAAAGRLSDQALSAGGSEGFQDAYRQSVDRLEELVARDCESVPTSATGATGAPTPATGPTGGRTPPPTKDTGRDNGQPDTPPADEQPQTPPDDAPPGDGGVGNPDSGGVSPQ